MLMLDHALPGSPGGPGGPGGPTMPLNSDPETPRKSKDRSQPGPRNSAVHPEALGQMALLGRTLEQGEELLVGCSRQAWGPRGARKPNADSGA